MTLATAIAVLAACTNPAAQPPTGGTHPASVSAQTSTRPATPTTSTATLTQSTLDCGDFIGTATPSAPLQVILGVVALPTSPAHPALQTSLTGKTGPDRLFAKTGLLIKPGASFELIVPNEHAGHLGIGWANVTPTTRLAVTSCANPRDTQWLAYAGGYWIDHPACVPLIVTAGGKRQQVHIGLGTACPGQMPPAGPNQT